MGEFLNHRFEGPWKNEISPIKSRQIGRHEGDLEFLGFRGLEGFSDELGLLKFLNYYGDLPRVLA